MSLYGFVETVVLGCDSNESQLPQGEITMTDTSAAPYHGQTPQLIHLAPFYIHLLGQLKPQVAHPINHVEMDSDLRAFGSLIRGAGIHRHCHGICGHCEDIVRNLSD
jgi:hypothetical protein